MAMTKALSVGSVIQIPIIIGVAHPNFFSLVQFDSRGFGEIGFDVDVEGSGGSGEIFLVPFEDGRQPKGLGLHFEPVFLRVAQEPSGLVVELFVQLGTHVGFGTEWRTSLGGAHERDVDPRFLVFRPNDFMLEMPEVWGGGGSWWLS